MPPKGCAPKRGGFGDGGDAAHRGAARRADEEVGLNHAATLSRHFEGVGLTLGVALSPVDRHGRVVPTAPVLADLRDCAALLA